MASAKEREFNFTERDFNRVRKLVSEHTGISLSDAKRDLVYSRLSRRLRKLGLGEFDAYIKLLENSEDDNELIEFTNAITTNLTSFFREDHHFQHLSKTLLPELIREKKKTDGRLRIWSAGCSTGEEPYSLAMILRETLGRRPNLDVRILATDLDSNVLATAQAGVYSEERLKGVSKARQQRWFLRGKGAKSGMVRAHPELQELISFRQLNLLREWPFQGPFDFIFCRNVVIYFDKPTQKVLFNRYADILRADGHLFLGHSETMFKVCDRFELLGHTIYRRTR